MQKNNNKGFFKRVKWENIFTILMVIFNLMAIYKHIQINGVYNELGVEFFVYFGLTFGFRYVIKDMRLNAKEWLNVLFDNK
jgi:hypothetical protein